MGADCVGRLGDLIEGVVRGISRHIGVDRVGGVAGGEGDVAIVKVGVGSDRLVDEDLLAGAGVISLDQNERSKPYHIRIAAKIKDTEISGEVNIHLEGPELIASGHRDFGSGSTAAGKLGLDHRHKSLGAIRETSSASHGVGVGATAEERVSAVEHCHEGLQTTNPK